MDLVRSSKIAFLLCALVGMSACTQLSDEEKKQRQQDAFDLSGDYTVRAEGGSEVAMAMKIVNKSGRHDVNVRTTRTTDLTAQELAILQQTGVDPALVRNAFVNQPVSFGSILSSAWDGGNSISKDRGKSTQFMLCSETKLKDIATAVPQQTATVEYCISGVAEKAALIMIRGTLTLLSTTTRPYVDAEGKRQVEIITKSANIRYGTADGKPLRAQYVGSWTGQVWGVQNVYFANLVGVEMVQEGSSYHAYPLYREIGVGGATRVRKDTIQVNGVNYNFEKVEASSQVLDSIEYPTVRMLYRKADGGPSRVVFVGTLWSLSSFTGNILLVEAASEKEIGSFKFSR